MVTIGTTAVKTLTYLLTSEQGISGALAQMGLEDSPLAKEASDIKILDQHVNSDLAERSPGARYPVIYVYCQRVRNLQREKFRLFSGTLEMAVEIRVTHDKLDYLQSSLHTLVDAVVSVLSSHIGMWADGICYGGGYEIAFDGVKRGGKNYLQSATIKIDLNVSRD